MPMNPNSRPLWGAVLPAAPDAYDREWMARLTDIVRKIVEQLAEPSQLTSASAVFTDLPQETPRYDIEGEVFTKVCANCNCVVLAINQTIAEEEQAYARRRFRVGSVRPSGSKTGS